MGDSRDHAVAVDQDGSSAFPAHWYSDMVDSETALFPLVGARVVCGVDMTTGAPTFVFQVDGMENALTHGAPLIGALEVMKTAVVDAIMEGML